MKQTRPIIETFYTCDGYQGMYQRTRCKVEIENPAWVLGDYHFCSDNCLKRWVDMHVEYSWEKERT